MCQIQNINDIACRNSLSLKLEQLLVTGLRKLRIPLAIRKIKKYKTLILNYLVGPGNTFPGEKNSTDCKNFPSLSLMVGDLVRVRSKEQIMQTLDENKKLEGCVFMEEMWQYCGSEYKVIKKVDHFFDEAKFRMRRTRNIVLLEGLHCSGNLPIFTHKCDRHCFYFWKEAWLERKE